MYSDLSQLAQQLARSQFRSKFHLGKKESDYLLTKGLPTILSHGRDFIRQRLAAAHPFKDGRQTPWAGHPVFIAQHATATCCRSCLEKWHHIKKDRALTDAEQAYILSVIEYWLNQQLTTHHPI